MSRVPSEKSPPSSSTPGPISPPTPGVLSPDANSLLLGPLGYVHPNTLTKGRTSAELPLSVVLAPLSDGLPMSSVKFVVPSTILVFTTDEVLTPTLPGTQCCVINFTEIRVCTLILGDTLSKGRVEYKQIMKCRKFRVSGCTRITRKIVVKHDLSRL